MKSNKDLDAKRALWKERVCDFQANGLSQAEWCRRQNIKKHLLSYWIKKFKEASLLPISETRFVEVPIPNDPMITCAPMTIRNGEISIDIAAGCPQPLLADLIGALKVYA